MPSPPLPSLRSNLKGCRLTEPTYPHPQTASDASAASQVHHEHIEVKSIVDELNKAAAADSELTFQSIDKVCGCLFGWI